MKSKIIITALLGLVLAGPAVAAEGAFFATGSFEYQFTGSDILTPGCTTYDELQFVNSGNPLELCSGSNPRGEFKVGYEFAFGDWRNKWYAPIFQIGYKHRSNWFSGIPFNNEKEFWSDYAFLEFKVGGLR